MNMVQTDIMTLTRYMIENTKQFPDAQDLEVLLSSIQVGRGGEGGKGGREGGSVRLVGKAQTREESFPLYFYLMTV